MDTINLDDAINQIISLKRPVTHVLIIKKYVPINKKIIAIDEFISEVIETENNRMVNIDPIKKYIKFTLMAIKLYTNLELNGTYDEYDKLQSNGLIDKILKEVKNDYMDLKSFMDMRFEYTLAQYYSSIQEMGDINGC